MIQSLLYGLLGLATLAYAIEYVFISKDDAKEPPRLHSKIPLVGHLFGFVVHGPGYYHTRFQESVNSEVYTVGIANLKIYASTSARLLPAIQRHAKTLSFTPLLQVVAQKWGDAKGVTLDLFGDAQWMSGFGQTMKKALAPGARLDEQNWRMGNRVLADMEELVENSGGQIKLLAWSRHVITQASSCGVYGIKHPFIDPEVEEAWWKWHDCLITQLTLSGLSRFGLNGTDAQQKVWDAHAAYFKNIPSDASDFVTGRWKLFQESGMSEEDCIKQQGILPIVTLSNTVPTFYWTIWELFSRPTLLGEVRTELQAQAIIKTDDGFALDLASLKTKCPLLLSVMQETQRTRHIHAATRKVLKDTLLDDKYLLKEGSYLQVAPYPIHFNPKVWGPKASEFDPYRFVKPSDTKQSNSDFLAWGAPPHLCPARQFAATEILILLALMAMRVDLAPTTGIWEKNPALDPKDPITILNPKKDVTIQVTAKTKHAGKWTLIMSESKIRVPLASG